MVNVPRILFYRKKVFMVNDLEYYFIKEFSE